MLCDDITQNVKKSSFLKKVCDGEVIVTKLYQAGDVKIDINGKLFITTNHMLTFDTNDFGIQRRLKYYDYKNVFKDRDEDVNEDADDDVNVDADEDANEDVNGDANEDVNVDVDVADVDVKMEMQMKM